MRRQDFEFLLDMLKDNAGWEFDESQYFIIDKKISNFIREKGFNTVEDLILELKMDRKPLISQVVEAMAFSDTSFFRDFDVFFRFQNALLPEIKEKCRAAKKLNIWSLGCSTGQETYSIAMAVAKANKMFADWEVSIVGSDLSSLSISKAQHGKYNNFEIQMGMNARTILEFFTLEDDMWSANEDIRKMVEFRRYNMLEDIVTKSKFEIIFCRNVLRYFAPEYQDKILQRISSHQPQGGYLYLGKNEVIPSIEKYYYRLNNNTGAYVAIGNQNTLSNTEISVEDTKDTTMPSFVRPKFLA